MLYTLTTHWEVEAVRSLDPGRPLVLRFGRDWETWDAAFEAVPRERRKHPGASIIAWADNCTTEQHMLLYDRARGHGIRALIRSTSPDRPFLVAQLTNPNGLARDIRLWIEHILDRTDHTFLLLERLLSLGCRGLNRAASRLEMEPRTLRTRFARACLPPPGNWLKLIDLLPAALALQAQPRRTAYQFITQNLDLDYRNFSRRSDNVFGCSPRQLQDAVGMEPLLWRWYRTQSSKWNVCGNLDTRTTLPN